MYKRQHEIAPIYSDANTACDKNQLTMEMLKKVAARHGLVCLLHEKPFAGINGSGKHDNWSLATDTGENLLRPGSTPSQNAQFLLFLAAFVKGVDEYQEMLRCCVSYPCLLYTSAAVLTPDLMAMAAPTVYAQQAFSKQMGWMLFTIS